MLVPFWTSLLVRSFALVLLLRDTGVVNETRQAWGLDSVETRELGGEAGLTLAEWFTDRDGLFALSLAARL